MVALQEVRLNLQFFPCRIDAETAVAAELDFAGAEEVVVLGCEVSV